MTPRVQGGYTTRLYYQPTADGGGGRILIVVFAEATRVEAAGGFAVWRRGGGAVPANQTPIKHTNA